MDHSQYLKQKMRAQTTYIARQQFMDAGLRTYNKQKAADTYYVSQNNNAGMIHTPVCCTPGSRGDYVAPVQPAPGCAAAGACSQLSDPYTTPYITLPCCPITYAPSTIIAAAQPCYCAVGTQSTISYAVMNRVNKEERDCC